MAPGQSSTLDAGVSRLGGGGNQDRGHDGQERGRTQAHPAHHFPSGPVSRSRAGWRDDGGARVVSAGLEQRGLPETVERRSHDARDPPSPPSRRPAAGRGRRRCAGRRRCGRREPRCGSGSGPGGCRGRRRRSLTGRSRTTSRPRRARGLTALPCIRTGRASPRHSPTPAVPGRAAQARSSISVRVPRRATYRTPRQDVSSIDPEGDDQPFGEPVAQKTPCIDAA